MKLPLALFAVGVCLGGAFTWRPPAPEIAPDPSPAPPAPAPAPVPQAGPKWGAEDLLKRAREVTGGVPAPGSAFEDLLEDWTLGEIRAALDEALTDPDYTLPGGGGGIVVDILFGEWMDRDLEGAIAWFDAAPIESAQRRMALSLSFRWPEAHADRGLDFVLAHRGLFSHGSAWSILEKNVLARAKDGPQALGALLERLVSESFTLDFGFRSELPDGFDFATFVTTDGFLANRDKGMIGSLLSQWLQQDREAASTWILAEEGPAALVEKVRSIPFFNAEAQLDQWQWLGQQLHTLPDEQQQELLSAATRACETNALVAFRLAQDVQSPEIRDHLHALGATAIERGEVAIALEHLRAIGDPTRRLEVLETLAEPVPQPPFASRRPVTDADRALLRTALTEWNASPAQIETFLSAFAP